MRTIVITLFFTFIWQGQHLIAQDFIYKKDGNIIKSSINLVDTTYVYYYQWPKRKRSSLQKESLTSLDSIDFGLTKPIYSTSVVKNAIYAHGGGGFGPGAGIGYSAVAAVGRNTFLAINGEVGYTFRSPSFSLSVSGNYGRGRNYFEFGGGVAIAPNSWGSGQVAYLFNPCFLGYRMQPNGNGFFMRVHAGLLVIRETFWWGGGGGAFIYPAPTLGLSLGYGF